jgi:hypothetical protein
LIQEDATGPPVIPALTPIGFAHWETIQILSYPGEEWQRLSQVVHDTSILADGSIVEGKHESLPRQLSRHLFPRTCNPHLKKFLDEAIIKFLDDLGSLTQRGAKQDQFHPFSLASSAADLVRRHLKDQQMLKPFDDRSESVYSTSSFGSYGRGCSRSSPSSINSKASGIFSVGLDCRYRPQSPPRRTLPTKSKGPPFLLPSCSPACLIHALLLVGTNAPIFSIITRFPVIENIR